jgi:serine/threonine-protein kinase
MIVELTVSLGVKMVQVPAEGVVGVAVADAEAALRAEGLDGEIDASTEVYDTDTAEGLVLSVEPEGGSDVPHNQAVRLVVSLGPEPVEAPKLTGLDMEDAAAAAEPFDLDVVKVGEEYSETVAEGLIISQSPEVGVGTHRGQQVSVMVSLGMPWVKVPEVADLKIAEAEQKLKDAGLQVNRQGFSLINRALRTDPAAGESVRKGSTVTLYVT